MQDFQQIEDQIAHYDKELAALIDAKNKFEAERGELVQRVRGAELEKVKAKIQRFGFSKKELGLDVAKAKPAVTGPKKFRNPETGDEWSGKGSEPSWIGSNKDLFLNPAWEEHKKKKKSSGKAKSADSVAQAAESTKPVADAEQAQTSASIAPYSTTTVTEVSGEPTGQGTAQAVDTVRDEVTTFVATVVATNASEASTVNVNAASTPASVLPAVDISLQPMAIAA